MRSFLRNGGPLRENNGPLKVRPNHSPPFHENKGRTIRKVMGGVG